MRRILPIILCVFLMIACSLQQKPTSIKQNAENSDSTIKEEKNLSEDSFTVVYRQPVNGYKVKAVARLDTCWFVFISAGQCHRNG